MSHGVENLNRWFQTPKEVYGVSADQLACVCGNFRFRNSRHLDKTRHLDLVAPSPQGKPPTPQKALPRRSSGFWSRSKLKKANRKGAAYASVFLHVRSALANL